ncbi:MAG: VCBS repeat-containing protein [Cyclobacteriaceae bacterium]|nr:VCBS repeat-containing protein [Cyclobacteriaceae bacterium]
MRKSLLGFSVFLFFGATGAFGQEQLPSTAFELATRGFEENRGQVRHLDAQYPHQVQYILKDKGVTLFFHKTGITYQMTSFEYVEDESLSPMRAGKNRKKVKSVSTYRFDQVWEGASENTTLQAEEPLAGTSFYWLAESQVGVSHYAKIIYRNIYPNIDIEYYIKDNRLKYDVVVKPGGDVQQVQFQYEGGVEPALVNGKIQIETPLGFLEEQQPVTYSKSGRKLSSQYSRQAEHFGFSVPEGNQEQAFTIDPDLIWGTYYGGTLEDITSDVVIDVSGNVYLAGTTDSNSGIAASGFQTTYAGAYDAFLVKFNSAGVRQWGTYYGGTGDEASYGLSVDGTGNVYLSGYTNSATGISLAGGHQTVIGGSYDAFLVKFNSSGTRQWATYYGGTGDDFPFSNTTDGSGNVYLVGRTNSTSAIAVGGHQNINGGLVDAFLVKFNSSGVRQFATYYGGTGDEYGLDCEVDASGNIFLSGQTFSTNAISTTGSHQIAYGGNRDAFLVKFNSAGVRQFGTYYGGTGADFLYASTIDAGGNIIISGDTESASAIASGGHQNSLLGVYDAFVVKFNTSGVRQWGTYYGNTGTDYAAVYKCIATDVNSNIFLTGNTNSTSGIASGGAFTTLAGGSDAYLVKFNASGVRQWSTYFGGTLDESANAVGFDPTTDYVYISGNTYSTSGIGVGGHQSTLSGLNDGYLAKFRGTALPIPTITSFSPTSAASGASLTITGTNFSATPANNTVYFGGAKATVTGATATTLTVTVPVGATHRPISVTINSLTAYSPQSFKPTFSGSGTIDATTLAAKVDFTTGTFPDYVSLADADIDGKSDILVSNGNSATFSALRNVSTSGSIIASSFSTKVDFTTAVSPNSVEYGDLDGDGKLDMVVANATSNSISLYRNVSTPGAITTGSFAAKVDFSTSLSNPRNLAIRDFDGDGKPDIAVSNGNSANAVVFRNTTSVGAFTSGSLAIPVSFTAGTSPSGIASGDVDGDGKADLIISNSSSNTISVFRNTSVSGTISFAAKVDFTTGTGPHNLAVADIDGDGKEDIIVPNSTAGTVSVIRNNSTVGTISLAAKVDFTAGSNTIGIAVGDLNGDGKLDVISSNTLSNNISVFRNTATSGSITTGSLAAKVDFTTGIAPSYGIAVGDLDGDGKPDIVVPNSGTSANTVSVFRNNSSSTATEPTAQPTGFISSAITSNSFTVSFTAAAGPPTGYLAVWKIGSNPTTDPVDGTSYVAGGSLGDGTIGYSGSATTFNQTGMGPGTTYFYKIYSYNGSGSGINYRQVSPLPGTVTTLTPPPATADLALTNVTNSIIEDLVAVRFVDAVTAFAVGTNGTAIKTINAGTSWTNLISGTTNTLWNVFFTNTNTGYIVGNLGLILKTTNSGSTWSTLITGTTEHLYAISFPSDNIGYAVGNNGAIIKTTNAGTSWTPLTLGASVSYLNSVVFFDANTGLTSGPGGVFRTTDGGTTWTKVSTLSILWLTFPTSTVGYGVGESGAIVKTSNGGVSWTTLSSNTGERLWGAHFTSTDVGFAVGENGTAIKTANGGSTWTTMTIDTDVSTKILYAIHFGTVSEGLAVGEIGTILKTEAELPEIPISSSNFKNEIPVKGSTSVSITIPATDVSRVDEVNLYVFPIRDIADGIYTNGEIFPATLSSNTYSANMQDPEADPIGYYYFFEIAYDGFNRYTYSDEGYAYLKYENTNTLKLPSLKAGSTTSDYQIISVPLVLTNAQVSAVFNEFGAADNKQWRMFTYQSGNTTPLSISGSITPGKGYWLITKTATTIDVGPGKTVTANGESPFSLTLAAGWNLIGNPYNFGVTWNAGTNVRELKQFSNGTYSTSSTLQPFVGYFVFANTPGNYPIPVTGAFTGGRTRTNRFDQTETSWELPITLQRGDLKNELGGIGMHQEADAGFDTFDEPALPIPTMQNMFAMIFDRPDLPYSLNKEVVPADQNYTWNFTIDQPEGNDAVEMRWDPMLLAKLKHKLYLYDEANLEVVDMTKQSMYYTQANATLTILYGDDLYIKNSLATKDARIAQPYPNPANENMHIPVVLPEAGLVALHLHDSYGRSIYEVEQYYDQGHHRISIQNLNEIPAGIYFVTAKIQSGTSSQRKTFKIVINKNAK